MLYVNERNLPEQMSVKTSASFKLPSGIIVRKFPCENGSGMLYLFSFTFICMKQSLNFSFLD